MRDTIMKLKQKMVNMNKENYLTHLLVALIISGTATFTFPLLSGIAWWIISTFAVFALEFVNEFFIDAKSDYKDILWTMLGCMITLIWLII